MSIIYCREIIYIDNKRKATIPQIPVLHLHKSYKSIRPFIEEGVTFISNLAAKRDEEKNTI